MKKTTSYFENLYRSYTKRELVSPDPLQFVYLFKNKKDKEIGAFLCACFAYGNVKQIIKNLTFIFEKMDFRPSAFIANTSEKQMRKIFKGFRYRFTGEEELINLLLALKQILAQHETLEKCFLHNYFPQEDTILPSLRLFARQFRACGKVDSLIPDPDKKSALKRLNLFLRWMIRKDEVDIGLWKRISSARLIIPLDTHMHRLALRFRLTQRKSADIFTALEITNSFRKHAPDDPVKYDFCLTRFGIREDMDYTDL